MERDWKHDINTLPWSERGSSSMMASFDELEFLFGAPEGINAQGKCFSITDGEYRLRLWPNSINAYKSRHQQYTWFIQGDRPWATGIILDYINEHRRIAKYD